MKTRLSHLSTYGVLCLSAQMIEAFAWWQDLFFLIRRRFWLLATAALAVLYVLTIFDKIDGLLDSSSLFWAAPCPGSCLMVKCPFSVANFVLINDRMGDFAGYTLVETSSSLGRGGEACSLRVLRVGFRIGTALRDCPSSFAVWVMRETGMASLWATTVESSLKTKKKIL